MTAVFGLTIWCEAVFTLSPT
jgi:hypothetical protein